MDLALLRTFVTVHRAGSFTRAAVLLGLSQPAVTSQIRTLERQLGRPLFLRKACGVTPTSLGEGLAHKAAPHLDALVEIAESGLGVDGGPRRTLHLAGSPEFTAERVLPALSELISQDGPAFSLHASFGTAEEVLKGLAAGHHDLAISTAKPRGALLTATALCDEEHVLVASPAWARHISEDRGRQAGAVALEALPVVEVHESLPLISDTGLPSSTPALPPPGPSSCRICGLSSPAPARARPSRCSRVTCARPPSPCPLSPEPMSGSYGGLRTGAEPEGEP